MIASGEKKEEYRAIKLYWATRLCGSATYKGNDKGLLPNNKDTYWNGFYPINFQKFDIVRFRNGYSKNAPSIDVECVGIQIGLGMLTWGAELDVEYFIIQLGNVLQSKI